MDHLLSTGDIRSEIENRQSRTNWRLLALKNPPPLIKRWRNKTVYGTVKFSQNGLVLNHIRSPAFAIGGSAQRITIIRMSRIRYWRVRAANNYLLEPVFFVKIGVQL
jgi:hypothetical protein